MNLKLNDNNFVLVFNEVKKILDDYLQLVEMNYVIRQAAWMTIYLERQGTNTRTRNHTAMFHRFDPIVLFNYCNADLALFIFIILYIETKKFRDSISMDENEITSSLSIIKDSVKERAPHLITLDDTSYNQKALAFINEVFTTGTSRNI